MSGLTSPSTTNLLSSAGNDTIAPDVEETDLEAGRGSRTAGGKQAGSTASGNQLGAPSGSTAAQGQMNAPQREQSIWEQSAHPVALFFLLFFRSLAIVVYLLCGFFSSSYVFSTVLVVVLLSMDFWTVRNVSGRVLVGLRFWNQVDDDGTSYWVFESRDPSQPANAVDSKMFWMALYAYPAAWIALLFVAILKFNISFLPIVLLALVFNITNVVGFTYADRDSKRKWATGMAASSMFGSIGGVGGSIVSGLVRGGISKVLG
ncbi:DUF846-domain-containing protein [Cystobasidium minutum MCA 4210]|uniref:DUF846-domain-containing protein n=1 Tax=Cystobasidium minutum MCA 4210 TaxID=1397322 RepID=UPI0034D01CA3|eukprot:jgi/Rhomi1/210723/estExt_Genemark1.C_4_t10291